LSRCEADPQQLHLGVAVGRALVVRVAVTVAVALREGVGE